MQNRIVVNQGSHFTEAVNENMRITRAKEIPLVIFR